VLTFENLYHDKLGETGQEPLAKFSKPSSAVHCNSIFGSVLTVENVCIKDELGEAGQELLDSMGWESVAAATLGQVGEGGFTLYIYMYIYVYTYL